MDTNKVTRRLPKVARAKLRQGGSHKSRKDYDRRKEKVAMHKLAKEFS